MIRTQRMPCVQRLAASLFGAGLLFALSLTAITSVAAPQAIQPESQTLVASGLSPDIERLQATAAEAMANQNWEVAEDLLLQAQYALHREHGVVTHKQAPILDQLAAVHANQADYRQANRLKEFNHFLGQRSTSLDEQTRTEIALARWYLYSGQFDAARRLLSASLRAELAREPFVPERALLRLDIELFSAQCCHSKDAIALLTRAEAEDLPTDLLAQFAQKVSRLLVLDERHDLAAEYYSRVGETQTQAPHLIPGLRRYNDLDPNKVYDMKLKQELRRRRLLAGGFPDDALWSEAPETFTVALSDDFLPVAQSSQSESSGYSSNFEPLIGSPFRFNLEQIKQALPTRYRQTARLETLEVLMTLDITKEGKPKNIRFEGRYPRQIRTLMKRVLKVARFKPSFSSGLAVDTLNFPLIQNFKSPGDRPTPDV